MRGVLLIGLILLMGCAAKPYVSDAPRLPLLPEPAPMAAVSTVTVTAMLPEPEAQRLMASEPPSPETSPAAVLASAHAHARILPQRRYFDGAILRYPHVPGNVYRVTVGIDAPLTIIIPADQRYVMSAGLDQRWVLKVPEASQEPGQEYFLLLIAPAPKLTSRLTIITDRAAYFLEVVSQVGPGLTSISWDLPAVVAPADDFLAHGEYRVGYTIHVASGSPIWTPLQVWDVPRRHKTLILFPVERLTHEAPVLYVLGADGTKQLVNYRPRGQWYEVDRLFERGELRVGHDESAEVVQVVRSRDYRALRCPGQEGCPPLQGGLR